MFVNAKIWDSDFRLVCINDAGQSILFIAVWTYCFVLVAPSFLDFLMGS